jgi:four helix bundle protein
MTPEQIERSEPSEELPVFVKWMDFLKWLLHTTEKFPKSVRFTFTSRITNLALDMVEDLTEARYTKHKLKHLRDANLRLEKLRMLIRISYEEKYIPHQGYKHAMYSINEVGKMIGGWIKQQETNK